MIEETIYDNIGKFKDILQDSSVHEEFRNQLLGELTQFNAHKLFKGAAEEYEDITYYPEKRLVYKSKYYDGVHNFDPKKERVGGGQLWGYKVELRMKDNVVKGTARSKGILHPDPASIPDDLPDHYGFFQGPVGEEHFEEVLTEKDTPEDVRSLIEEHEDVYVEVGKRWRLIDYDAEEIIDTALERNLGECLRSNLEET